jgi:hypothetical protein
MVVIVVRFDVHSGFGVRGRVWGKEVRMNLPGVSVIAIGTCMDMLKRREAECQQERQACLDSGDATHQFESVA